MVYVFILVFTIILIVTLTVIAAFFWGMLMGAPYAGTNFKKMEQVVQLVQKMNVRKMADVGSGDGRFLIALARLGYEVHGFEVNPFLVWLSRWRMEKAGLAGRAFVHGQNVFLADLSSFDFVFVFVLQGMMNKLERKLQQELKPGAVVISHHFQFPNWPARERVGELWVYEK